MIRRNTITQRGTMLIGPNYKYAIAVVTGYFLNCFYTSFSFGLGFFPGEFITLILASSFPLYRSLLGAFIISVPSFLLLESPAVSASWLTQTLIAHYLFKSIQVWPFYNEINKYFFTRYLTILTPLALLTFCFALWIVTDHNLTGSFWLNQILLRLYGILISLFLFKYSIFLLQRYTKSNFADEKWYINLKTSNTNLNLSSKQYYSTWLFLVTGTLLIFFYTNIANKNDKFFFESNLITLLQAGTSLKEEFVPNIAKENNLDLRQYISEIFSSIPVASKSNSSFIKNFEHLTPLNFTLVSASKDSNPATGDTNLELWKLAEDNNLLNFPLYISSSSYKNYVNELFGLKADINYLHPTYFTYLTTYDASEKSIYLSLDIDRLHAALLAVHNITLIKLFLCLLFIEVFIKLLVARINLSRNSSPNKRLRLLPPFFNKFKYPANEKFQEESDFPHYITSMLSSIDSLFYERDMLAIEYETLLSSAEVPIFSITASGNVDFWNNKIASITSFSADSIIGNDIRTIFPSLSISNTDQEQNVILKSPVIAHFNFIGSRRKTRNKSASGIIFIGRNVTDLVNAQSKLISSSKLTAAGEMAVAVGHELNQPLNVISLSAASCLRNLKDINNNELSSFLTLKLDRILSQVERASTILTRIKQYGTKDTDKSDNVNFNSLVFDSLQILSDFTASEKISLINKVNKYTYFIFGNHIQIEQVIINIINNAIDAYRKKPYLSNKIIETSLYGDANNVHLRIRDYAGGIVEEAIPHVFEPFYSTHSDRAGRGLGLAISLSLIEMHSGTLTFQTDETGTAFTITLPVLSFCNSEFDNSTSSKE